MQENRPESDQDDGASWTSKKSTLDVSIRQHVEIDLDLNHKIVNSEQLDAIRILCKDCNNNNKDGNSVCACDCSSVASTAPSTRSATVSWWNKVKGIVMTIVSALSFSLTTVIVKQSDDLNASQMAFFRYLGKALGHCSALFIYSLHRNELCPGIGVLILPMALEVKQSLFGTRELRVWLILRSLAGATSLYFRYSALDYLSLANVTVIMLAMPIFVFVFARLLLKEEFGIYHMVALVVSTLGIVLASRLYDLSQFSNHVKSNSTVLLDHNHHGHPHHSSTPSPLPPHPSTFNYEQIYGVVFSLGAMFIGSFVYVFVRKVSPVSER